jgi:hypothetical protein
MDSLNTKATALLAGTITSLVVVSLFGLVLFFLPFWGLWNWIMPVFGVAKITLLQSVGLYLLLRIILFQPTYTHKQ